METLIRKVGFTGESRRVLNELSQEEIASLKAEMEALNCATCKLLKQLIEIEELTLEQILEDAWRTVRSNLEFRISEVVEEEMQGTLEEELGKDLAQQVYNNDEYYYILDQYKDKVEVRY